MKNDISLQSSQALWLREDELNGCYDFVAVEIEKSSEELQASNAACQACLEKAGKHKMIKRRI